MNISLPEKIYVYVNNSWNIIIKGTRVFLHPALAIYYKVEQSLSVNCLVGCSLSNCSPPRHSIFHKRGWSYTQGRINCAHSIVNAVFARLSDALWNQAHATSAVRTKDLFVYDICTWFKGHTHTLLKYWIEGWYPRCQPITKKYFTIESQWLNIHLAINIFLNFDFRTNLTPYLADSIFNSLEIIHRYTEEVHFSNFIKALKTLTNT